MAVQCPTGTVGYERIKSADHVRTALQELVLWALASERFSPHHQQRLQQSLWVLKMDRLLGVVQWPVNAKLADGSKHLCIRTHQRVHVQSRTHSKAITELWVPTIYLVKGVPYRLLQNQSLPSCAPVPSVFIDAECYHERTYSHE